MTDKEYTELDRSQSEIYKYLDEIGEILSRKTKEERLEYFSKIGFPRSLNFNLDFGKSVIMVRTHFEGNYDETVCENYRANCIKKQIIFKSSL